MFIKVTLKCDEENVPYRIYINDELITERFYTFPKDVMYTEERFKHKVKNVLDLEIKDFDDYDVTIESSKVRIEEVKWQEQRFEN